MGVHVRFGTGALAPHAILLVLVCPVSARSTIAANLTCRHPDRFMRDNQ